MPELPEVETLKRELSRKLVGKTIAKTEVNWAKMVAPLSPAELGRELKGEKIAAIERRAKILIITLVGKKLILIHLKMTGQLIFQDVRHPHKLVVGGHPQKEPFTHTRLILHFQDGSKLLFNDLRKFGWFRLSHSEHLAELTKKIGPEPLSKNFTLDYFQSLFKRFPKRKVKQLLLDQHLIAGLGNIYVDESCFLAKVLPTRLAHSLKPSETKKLHQEIICVLKFSIASGGTSARNYRRSDGSKGNFIKHLKVYGRGGKPCLRCKGEINKIRLNCRGTHFCERCQK